MIAFAAVHSTHLAAVCPRTLSAALLRRYCETHDEGFAEKASRAREFAGFTR